LFKLIYFNECLSMLDLLKTKGKKFQEVMQSYTKFFIQEK